MTWIGKAQLKASGKVCLRGGQEAYFIERGKDKIY